MPSSGNSTLSGWVSFTRSLKVAPPRLGSPLPGPARTGASGQETRLCPTSGRRHRCGGGPWHRPSSGGCVRPCGMHDLLIRGARIADQYPYTAGSTTLLAVLPGWAVAGGVPAMRERLADPAARRRLGEDLARL